MHSIPTPRQPLPVPRTRITYPVETGGAIEEKELPLIIGILADLSPRRTSPALGERKMIDIDRHNFDAIMGEMAPDIDGPAFIDAKETWLGLRQLVSDVETGPMVKLRVLHVSKEELHDDLIRAQEPDRSALFQTVHEAAYGTHGGAPYGVLVSTHAFADSANDRMLLERMASLAATSCALLIASATIEHSGGRSEDDFFLVLVPPPANASGHGQSPSIGPAYAMTRNIADAFVRNGWAPVATGTAHRLQPSLLQLLLFLRFMQTIKTVIRNKVGSFMTRANVEAYLNTWIAQYVLLDENASDELKTAYPLGRASVVVTDAPGNPGCYTATAFLAPHATCGGQPVSMRLIAQLPA